MSNFSYVDGAVMVWDATSNQIQPSGSCTVVGGSMVNGTGPIVLSNSPTLVTPALGVATATSVNGLTVTTSTGTITITNGKTASFSNSLTFAGTDATTLTFQGTDTYVGRATTDTFTNKTFDTAGVGNSFKINSVAVSTITGTGSVAMSASPTFTGTVGAAAITATGIVQALTLTSTGVINAGTSKFSISAAGLCTKYNNIAVVSNGIPSEYATVDSTGLVAAVATTTLYTPTATGMFRISAYLKITTAGTSPVLGPLTITFTDGTDSVAQSMVMQMSTQAGASATSNSGNTTTTSLNGEMIIFAKTGVAIQYAIALTGTVGTGAYEAHLKLEAL